VPDALLDAEMVFVTGKGGTGKTTVAAALGLAGRRAGLRTIVCELAGQARVPALLGARPGGPNEEVPLGGGPDATTIDAWRVLEEWVGHVLGSRALTGVLVRSRIFRGFSQAVPGGRELGTMAKVWELAQARRWDRHRRGYDLVVVDGPSSGHAVAMLRAPATFAEVARVGPIATQSARMRDWLRDERRTAYVAVARPTELAVAETSQLVDALEGTLGRRPAAVVVDGVLDHRFTPAEVVQVATAAGDPGIPRAVRTAEARAEAQAPHLAALAAIADGAGACLIELPFVAGTLDRAWLEAFAARLAG
jgi:Mrp family chromosome partitioning ATPase